jgi:hypothetical protein
MFATFIIVLFYRYDRVTASLWIRYLEILLGEGYNWHLYACSFFVAKKRQHLKGLSLLRVPHFRERRGASLKDLNPVTRSMSKAKCFLISQFNLRKDTNVDKHLELRRARVIYRVEQITHRSITTNKRDQVIVTMRVSKLKTKQEHNI